jgi:hypothetical protein
MWHAIIVCSESLFNNQSSADTPFSSANRLLKPLLQKVIVYSSVQNQSFPQNLSLMSISCFLAVALLNSKEHC